MNLFDLLGRVDETAVDYATFILNNLGKLGKWVASGFQSGILNADSAAYSPPFSGGQCEGFSYRVRATLTLGGSPWQNDASIGVFGGKIGAPYVSNGTYYFTYNSGANVGTISGTTVGGQAVDLVNFRVEPAFGGVDNCGDIPNPNPPSDPQDNPVPDGGSPVDTNGTLVNGGGNGGAVPPPVPPPFTPIPSAPSNPPAIDASLSGLAGSLGQLLGLINGIVSFLNSLLDLLDKLNKLFSKKEQRAFALGSVKGDGYLSFSPMVDDGWSPLHLEILVHTKPSNLSKWFGSKSPHFYNAGLGSVSFVDGSFCVRNGRNEINYVRSSFDCPQSIGFYYHLGLDNRTEAQFVLIMEKK